MSNIKAIRTRLGLRQVDLARVLGCTQGNIGHYENRGQTMPPELARRLIVYAKSLGQDISFDDIYAQSPDAPEAPPGPLAALAPPAVPDIALSLVDRRTAQLPYAGPDRRRSGIASAGQGV